MEIARRNRRKGNVSGSPGLLAAGQGPGDRPKKQADASVAPPLPALTHVASPVTPIGRVRPGGKRETVRGTTHNQQHAQETGASEINEHALSAQEEIGQTDSQEVGEIKT
ncbi:hypothetical protein KM043_002269 [Ampulex compressa]|nr:hypothetical protein KM043_002269 [Ampulex compressa]